MNTQSLSWRCTRNRGVLAVSTSLLLVLICGPSAFAVTITTCAGGIYIASGADVKLGNDLACDIKLQNGHNLDLNGYTLSGGSTQSQGVVYCDGGNNQANVNSIVLGPGTIDAGGRVATYDCGTVKNASIVDASTAIQFAGAISVFWPYAGACTAVSGAIVCWH